MELHRPPPELTGATTRRSGWSAKKTVPSAPALATSHRPSARAPVRSVKHHPDVSNDAALVRASSVRDRPDPSRARHVRPPPPAPRHTAPSFEGTTQRFSLAALRPMRVTFASDPLMWLRSSLSPAGSSGHELRRTLGRQDW